MGSASLTIDQPYLADLIARYGSSSATAWLEVERYHIWVTPIHIPESTFPPRQGYMQRDNYVFAWGNPLVSHPSALRPTVSAIKQWVDSQNMRLIWLCADEDLATVLGESPFRWSVAQCIGEDVIYPAHVLDLTSPAAVGRPGGASVVRDLKYNLKKAERSGIRVEHFYGDELSEKEKRAIDKGIRDWMDSRSGIQIASTTFQPWLDMKHRRYWVAKRGDKVIGVLILTPIHPNSWSITNAASFPDAPRGTSELLIYTTLVDLQNEKDQKSNNLNNGILNGHRPNYEDEPMTVTFGVSASPEFQSVRNLSGWRISMFSAAYKHVSRAAGLVERGQFRKKFDGDHIPMFVCFPPDQFGLEGIDHLIKCLRK